jgi:hypothetical protein
MPNCPLSPWASGAVSARMTLPALAPQKLLHRKTLRCGPDEVSGVRRSAVSEGR